jgi:hypothetical protein
MEKIIYYGTKVISAVGMSRLHYNQLRGWDLPADEDGEDAGYLVEYQDGGAPNVAGFDGYVSWSPAEQFENTYQLSGSMSFGHAIVAMKSGLRVGRSGWNGKGMFLYVVPAASYPAQRGAAKRWAGELAMIPYGAYIAMRTATGEVVPWLASQTDMLAEDWAVLED